jgi:tripartite-type tricarboxylate transporter receptor subunit TctC
MKRQIAKFLMALCFCLPGFAVQASQAEIEQFYKGKVLTLVVGIDTGGSYDQYARLLSRHLAKHIPGRPTIVVQNLPGAAGVRAAQRLYNASPRDGTEIGMIYRGVATMPLLGISSGYDPRKFTWLGSMNEETAVCLAWHTSPIKTFSDIFNRELIVGSTGQGSTTSMMISALATLLGAKFKLVEGYKGGAEIDLAMTRGEVEGRCGVSWSALKLQHPDWVSDKKVNVLVQLGFKHRPEIPGVPLIQTFAKTPEDRLVLDLMLAPQLMAYPFLAPPDLPKDRADALRKAFNATMADPEFIEDAKKQNMETELVPAEEIVDLLDKVYTASPAVVEKARKLVNPGK